MNNTRNVTVAFLIGGLFGAGLALLFAPQSGADTRRRIKEGMEDASDWAKDRYQDTRYMVSESGGKVRQFVSDKKDDLQAAFDAGKDAYARGKERLARES